MVLDIWPNNMNQHTETAVKTTYFSIAGNTTLALIKGVAGIFGNSYALIADAIESTTDIFASLLVLLGLKYASRPADENHPYGHGRIEPLVTFIVVAFLVISASIIAYESIDNISTPHDLPKPFTLFILGAIIIWKEASFRIVLKKSKETHSSSLKADAWHHRSDAITSVRSGRTGAAVGRVAGALTPCGRGGACYSKSASNACSSRVTAITCNPGGASFGALPLGTIARLKPCLAASFKRS